MKTLRILIALCIMLGLATNAVNAQTQHSKAQTFKESGEYHWHIACTDEDATGVYIRHWMWNENMQMSYYRLRLIGDVTGAEYTVKDMLIIQSIRDGNNSDEPYNFSLTYLIHKDGKPIALLHNSLHITLNAKGEITSVKEDLGWWECL